jgi:hypothetical protein
MGTRPIGRPLIVTITAGVVTAALALWLRDWLGAAFWALFAASVTFQAHAGQPVTPRARWAIRVLAGVLVALAAARLILVMRGI